MDWNTPKEVERIDMAFGPSDIDILLPKWDEIPKCYKNMNSRRPSMELTSRWFFSGLKGATFEPRKGIDTSKALRHIGSCLASWEPQHEHKTAGVAFLLDNFFERVTVEEEIYELNKEELHGEIDKHQAGTVG